MNTYIKFVFNIPIKYHSFVWRYYCQWRSQPNNLLVILCKFMSFLYIKLIIFAVKKRRNMWIAWRANYRSGFATGYARIQTFSSRIIDWSICTRSESSWFTTTHLVCKADKDRLLMLCLLLRVTIDTVL